MIHILITYWKQVSGDTYIKYDKALRPKRQIHYRKTYDKELLKKLKLFAVKHKLFINDVTEYSVKYINPDKARKYYRNRIGHI